MILFRPTHFCRQTIDICNGCWDHLTKQKQWGESAASLCSQVAAWFPDTFCNFYLVKNHKIAKNSTATKARAKNKHRFGILRILEFF